MTGHGTTTYTDPDDFRANVPGARVNLVLTSGEAFRARLTWVTLRHFALVAIEEAAPRIAFISPDPALVFISFPVRGQPLTNGVRLRRGDFVLHGAGEHLHQLAEGSTRWGQISIRSADLVRFGRTLLRAKLTPPRQVQFLRARTKVGSNILRLHAQACRLAVTKPNMIAHREVAHSIEQELIVAVVNLLSASDVRDRTAGNRRQAEIMVRFEKVLAAQKHQPSLSVLCAAIGVSQRTLRHYCRAFLGCSPLTYMRCRRLNSARSALSKSNRKDTTVAAIARNHGFSEVGRFAGAYRALFGETPSAVLLRNSAGSA